jgi:hypothetical protein
MAQIHEFPPRKESQPVRLREDPELEQRLIAAFGVGSSDTLKQTKQEYEERYPNEQEAIEALFGISEYLNTARAIQEMKDRGQTVQRELYRTLTEYNFTLTHFVKVANENQFLSGFWGLLSTIGRELGDEDSAKIEGLHGCVVTQVAIAKAFERLGEGTSIAHPDEDAYHATDMWAKGDAVQVKGANVKTVQFIDVGTMTYPAASVRHGNTEDVYTSFYDEAINRFGLKLKEYGEMKGRTIRGHFVVVPYAMVNWNTGEPSSELIGKFREHAESQHWPVKKKAA